MDEMQLIQAHLFGDQDAFATLYSRHKSKVFAICTKMCGRRFPNDINDLVQTVFLKTLNNLASFQGTCAFSTWLYEIARTTCLEFMRAARSYKHAGEYEQSLEHTDEHGVVKSYDVAIEDQAIHDAENLEELQKFFKLSSATDVEIVKLKLEGYTNKEIAVQTKLTVLAVKSRYNRTKQRWSQEAR